MDQYPDPAPGSYRRWVIFVIGSLNFVISMFYRASTAVISPTLIREMDMTSAQLSDLSAAFYYAFAAGQIPLGIALDRIGCRKAMCLLAFVAVGGVLVFATGQTPDRLILGRAVLGLGMSGNLMVLFALIAVWFPMDRFAFLTGAVIAVGVFGNLLASSPLALLSMHIGWRESFLICAGINAVVVLSFVLVIKDHPAGCPEQHQKPGSLVAGLGRLIRMYSFWAISLTSAVRYGYFAALQSLWLGPFLVLGMGMEEIAAGHVLFCMGVGYMLGLPLWGSVSDRLLRSRKRVVLPTMIAFALITLSFAYWTQSVPPWMLFFTFFCLGFTASPGQILYAHIKELLPASMVAQAITSVNLFTILGVGAMIHLLGLVLGDEATALSGPEGFRSLWFLGAVAVGLVSLLYVAVPDSKLLRSDER
ncbi:nitrate/nitrite transporter [Thermodesulfobacteriota bacterium]